MSLIVRPSAFARFEARLRALLTRKVELERRIEAEQRRPAPCSLTQQRLKRLRLALKDEISALRRKRPRDLLVS